MLPFEELHLRQHALRMLNNKFCSLNVYLIAAVEASVCIYLPRLHISLVGHLSQFSVGVFLRVSHPYLVVILR